MLTHAPPAAWLIVNVDKTEMRREQRKILEVIERHLARGDIIFCAPAEFERHRNFPEKGIVLAQVESIRALQKEGYLKFSSTQWHHEEKKTEGVRVLIAADVVESLTEMWTKEKRERERQFLAIATFFVLGVTGTAIAVYKAFW